MNRLFLIIGVAIMIAALVFLSQGIKKAAPTDADLEKQAQQQQTQQAQKQPPAAPTAQATAGPAALPSEETAGNPATARHHLQVGWVYDEADQANPELLTGPLQAIRDYANNSKGAVSAEIVNLDVPTEDRSPAAQAVTDLGISVDGNPALPGNFSEMRVAAPDITKALDQATGQK